MWKSKGFFALSTAIISVAVGGRAVTECPHVISIQQHVSAESQTRNSRVFPTPPLCFPVFCNPNCKQCQESQQVDEVLARISRQCFSKKKNNPQVVFVSKIEFNSNQLCFEVNENLLTLM